MNASSSEEADGKRSAGAAERQVPRIPGLNASSSDEAGPRESGAADVPGARVSRRATFAARDFRRGLCVRERDELCAKEAADMKLRERLGRQAFLTQKAQQAMVVDEKRSAAQLAEAKRSIKDAQAARKKLWAAAFGAESFFHASAAGRFRCAVESPCAAQDLAPPGCDDLSGAPAAVLALRGLCRSQEPTCYVTAVCQVLLRLPSLVAWLGWHALRCDAGAACVACLLYRSRHQIGEKALPELLLHRGTVGQVFDDAAHHEPLDFCEAILDALRSREVLAGRCVVWPGIHGSGEVVATHVDRLFAFVEECRSQCNVCGAARVEFERKTRLRLPAPGEDAASSRCLYDAYLAYCAPDAVVGAPCPACLGEQPHRVQRRLVTLPEVLILQVLRAREGGALARYRFCVDEQASLPSLGSMHLAAIMFHFGRGRETGHYTCASRGPDGGFWYFDDAREPVPLRSVVGFFDKNVDALVYTKSGLARPRQGGVEVGSGGRCDEGRPGRDVEAVRKQLEALRGPGAAAATQPGPSDDAGGGEHAEAVRMLRIHGSRLWGESSFRSLLFDDPASAEVLLAGLPEEPSGIAADFCFFVDGCREHGLGPADFEDKGSAQARVPPPESKGRGTAVSAARRAEELRARKAAFAQASRRRREMEAKARLFSTPGPAAVPGRAAGAGAARVAAAGFDVGPPSAGSGGSGAAHGAAGVQAGRSGSGQVVPGGATIGAPGRPARAPRQPGVRGSLLQTRLATKLRLLGLEEDVLQPVLAEMQRKFGEGLAWQLAGKEWLLDWERWALFVSEVQVQKQTWNEGVFVFHVWPVVGEFLFALSRVVAAQMPDAVRSNDEAIRTLRDAGLVCGTGQVWGHNACLMDSLLQLLMFHGVVREDVDRYSACKANREHLEARPELVPRDVHGHEDYGGYLQHHRHAEPTLQFFIAWFACSPEVLPAAGFRLVVHARSDDQAHPPDESLLCVQSGRRAGPCLACHLFNHTGRGHGGYHYDPLLPVPGAMEVSEDEVMLVEGAAAEEGAPGQAAGLGLEPRQRVLRRQKAMGGDEGLAAVLVQGAQVLQGPEAPWAPGPSSGLNPEGVVQHWPELGSGGVSSAAVGAGAPETEDRPVAGTPASLKPRPVLRRHNALGGDDDVHTLEGALAQMGLRDADVEMSFGGAGEEGTADNLPMDATTEKPPAATVPPAGGSAPAEAQPLTGRSDEALQGFLFDVAPLDKSRCGARIWEPDATRPVLAQCGRPRKSAEFCGTHATEAQRPHGVWDPPAHASLPDTKLKKATAAAARRASAVAPAAVAAPERSAEVPAAAKGRRQGRGRRGRGVQTVVAASSAADAPAGVGRGSGRAPAPAATVTAAEAGEGSAAGAAAPGLLRRRAGGKGRGERGGAGHVPTPALGEPALAGGDGFVHTGVPATAPEAAAPAPRNRSAAAQGRRIVTGFGSERVEDLVADERRREAEGARRGVARREEGTRGRMTTFGGEDLDRAAGGPWQAGRR